MRSNPERPTRIVCPPAAASLALAALLLFFPPLDATERPEAPPQLQRWSLEVVSGPSLGGPVGDLEAAMRAWGFGDTLNVCFFGCASIAHPVTYADVSDRTSSWGAVRHRLGRGTWHLGLGGGPSAFGSVEGYRESVGDRYVSVFVEAEASVVTLAPMAWFDATRALRLGAGPALHRVDLRVSGAAGAQPVRSRSWKPGLVVEAALTVPVDTPVFFAAVAQYRFSADATTARWETTTYNGTRVELPATSVRVSHGFVALGIGGRF